MTKLYYAILMVSIFNTVVSMEKKENMEWERTKKFMESEYTRLKQKHTENSSPRLREYIAGLSIACTIAKVPKDNGLLRTCFMFISMWNEYSSFLEALLKYGVDPNYADPAMGKALCVAAVEKASDNVALLLKYGADAKSRENCKVFKRTPLEAALFNVTNETHFTAIRIIELLLDKGADPYSKNAARMDAMEMAKVFDLQDIVLLMENYSFKSIMNSIDKLVKSVQSLSSIK